MEEWTELADRVQRTLLPIADGTSTSDFLSLTWEGHHATAIHNADGALQGLRFAAESCQASVDAYAMALSFRPRSPPWIAWISAGQSLKLRAVSGVTKATLMVRLMRRAVLAEYVAAYMILSR
ncbi:hypothetical protein C2845_PM08G04870 [Panicum miliaceum]|uniref:Uncharacterized protein n=1 Tax=Panicum miliaceum TaxID=4540 RepID=A0A3L6R0X6_PANMI|nr:hypothetical protein C2845_PM08G04870 [Panicum miliaceum]